jgi:uncharacterized membrane protein YbaN (DUF454 family)
MMMIRLIFIFLGTLCLLIGIVGIFVPGLPTTPFLLLTAGLYVRSSGRLYQKLLQNQWIGGYISRWQERRELPLITKITSISLMWAMILISVLFLVDSSVLKIVIAATGLIGTFVMGFVIPTRKN